MELRSTSDDMWAPTIITDVTYFYVCFTYEGYLIVVIWTPVLQNVYIFRPIKIPWPREIQNFISDQSEDWTAVEFTECLNLAVYASENQNFCEMLPQLSAYFYSNNFYATCKQTKKGDN